MAKAATLSPKPANGRHKPVSPARSPQSSAHKPESITRSPRTTVAPLPAYARSAVPSSELRQRSGQPLDSTTRQRLEARFQRDLSNVRVFPGARSKVESLAPGARAVTVGNHIYFSSDEYAPNTSEGQDLLAHEITHTIQQSGAEGRSDSRIGSVEDDFEEEARTNAVAAREGGPIAVRRQSPHRGPQPDEDHHGFWYNRVVGHYPWLKPILDRGIKGWIEDRVSSAFEAIVNFLLRPVHAIQNAAGEVWKHVQQLVDWIKHAAASIAKGDCSALHQAVDYIEKVVGGIVAPIFHRIKAIGKKIADFFTGLWNKFGAPIWGALKRFAGKVWQVITKIATWIWDKTAWIRKWLGRAWRWVKNKLGIGEGAEGHNGLLQWIEGKVEKAWNWIKEKAEPIKKPLMVLGGILLLLSPAGPVIAIGLAIGGIIEGVRAIKRYFGTRNGVVSARQILRTIVLPKMIAVIRHFAALLATTARGMVGALRRARDVVRNAASAAAHTIFSFLAGLLGWIADRLDDFVKWGEKGVLDFLAWVDRAVSGLARFLNRILDFLGHVAQVVKDIFKITYLLMSKIWHLIPACIRDPFIDFLGRQILGRIPIFSTLANTPEAWAKTKAQVGAIIRQIFVDFDLGGAMKTAFLLLLRVLDVPLELLEAVIGKLVQAWDVIKEKPVQFIKNLFRTIMLALKGFFKHILIHLRNGIVGWLTHSLHGANLHWPSSWSSPSEIFWFVVSVLGVSLDHVFERIALKLGPDRAARLRRMVNSLSGAWEWLRLIFQGRWGELWVKIQEKLTNLKDIVIQGMVDWLMKHVVEAVSAQLLTTADPTGISEAVMFLIDLYRTIKTVVQYMRQILTMVNQMLNSILNIANGVLQQAAGMIENAMDEGMPVVIGFLANLANLGNIGEGIREALDAIRAKVDVAIDWLIDKAKGALEFVAGTAKRAAAAVSEWWRERKRVKVGDQVHTLEWQGAGSDAQLMIESRPIRLQDFLNDLETKPQCNKTVVQEIRRLLREIETLKNGGSFGQKAGEKIAGLMEQVADLLPDAEPSVHKIPPTVIFNTTKNIDGSTVGKHVRAEPLSHRPPTNGWTGSQPGSGNAFWKKVNQRAYTYVQGHLLNHHLYGPGKPENLVPIHRSLNTSMSVQVEEKMKSLVLDENKVISYDINVVFGAWPPPPYHHIPEENQLPTAMEFVAHEMNLKENSQGDKPADWVVGNQIHVPHSLPNERGPDTVPSNTVERWKRVNLNSKDSGAQEAFQHVLYIGKVKAKRLYDHPGCFASLQDVIRELQLPKDAEEKWKSSAPPEVVLAGCNESG